MKQFIRIASGQGFWGDLLTAPADQVTKGPIDYLVMDYLAEVTMSIMQKQRRRDPKAGYASDLLPLLGRLLPTLLEKGVRVITNGGGANPGACRDEITALARSRGLGNFKIGVVHGDDVLDRLGEFMRMGSPLRNMESGNELSSIIDRVSSANVYFGSWPIVEALRKGAQIIVTGRTTDTGLTLAPMIHEFGWSNDDWDKLAAGTVAGHVLECGAQATGGNFSADWQSVPDMAHIGFPIAEAYPDGEVVITKHKGTGGTVTTQTVKEQLVYEIGNPAEYITPDCVADFTTVRLEQAGRDRVRLYGIKGRPATEFYKVSVSYHDGYTAVGTLTYSWPDALEKAQAADAILRARLADLGLHFDEVRTEFLGHNSCHGPLSSRPDIVNEVVLRVGVRGHDASAVERFGRELAPLVLTGPPGVTGFAGGRPRPSDVVAYWPALISKSLVAPTVEVTDVS